MASGERARRDRYVVAAQRRPVGPARSGNGRGQVAAALAVSRGLGAEGPATGGRSRPLCFTKRSMSGDTADGSEEGDGGSPAS